MGDVIKYGDVVLAGTGDSLSEYRLGHRRTLQERGALRAPAAGVLDRRRVAHSVGWMTTRSHASVPAARVFMLQHAQALTNETGTSVSFEFEAAGGSNAFTLLNAAVETTEASQLGLTTYHRYQVTGGAIV